MTKNKWHHEQITFVNSVEGIPLKLISDAAVATRTIADGRLIPVLLIDTSSRPDIENLIKAHKYFGPGDAKSSWGKLSTKQNTINLILRFEKPVKCTLIFEFDILEYGGIIDQIVHNKVLCIQCAKEGERFLRTFEREKVLIEVPSSDFEQEWEMMLNRTLECDGKRKGLNKKQAQEYSNNVIKSWREITVETRMNAL